MSRWFRFYGDALNDPKVQILPGKLFKTWVNLLCVASQRGGKLPVIHELTYLLRRRSDHLQRDLDDLVNRGLLDLVDDSLGPHKWSERQYESDTSAKRTKQWRDRQCDVTETVTVTPPDNRLQNTDTEKKKDISRVPRSDDGFEEFWNAYPKRASASPKKPARLKYEAARKRDVPRETILAGARAYAAEQTQLGKVGSQYVKTPEVWLGQEGWTAFTAEQAPNTGPPADLDPIARRDWIRKRMEQGGGGDNQTATTGGRTVLEGSSGFREADESKSEGPDMVRSARRNTGAMRGMAPLFSGPPAVFAVRISDDAGPENQDFPCADRMAGMVRRERG